MNALAASPSPIEWDWWALLAMLSAAALGAVNFVVGYQTAADWGSFRRKVWAVRINLVMLLALEALAGLLASWIVVVLGLTKPDWLDDPLGWLLLGTVGPALAGAAIATIKVGGSDVNLGLSLVYTPLRDHLLKRIDLQSFGFDQEWRQQSDALFRRLALEKYERGDRELPTRLLDALTEYSKRKLASDEERQEVELLLTQVEQLGASPEEQLRLTVAFVVRVGWDPILEGVIGRPSRDARKRLRTEAPPGRAVVPPRDPES